VGKDLYGDLERIEARAKRKRQPGRSKLFSIFGKRRDEEDVEDEEGGDDEAKG
jgi:hypothetical protein